MSSASEATTNVRVCAEQDLVVGEARRFDIADYRLALVRGETCWYAVDDECTHADFSLAEGEVDLEECTIECWKHGSLFSLVSGRALTLPATRAVKTYAVHVEAGEVAVALPRVSGRAADGGDR